MKIIISIATAFLLTTSFSHAQAPVATDATFQKEIKLRLKSTGSHLKSAGGFFVAASLIGAGTALVLYAIKPEDPDVINGVAIGGGVSAWACTLGGAINLLNAGNKLNDAYVSGSGEELIEVPAVSGTGITGVGTAVSQEVLPGTPYKFKKYSELKRLYGYPACYRILNHNTWEGMTIAQAQDSQGNPASITREGNTEVWEMPRGKMHKKLTFVDGKLAKTE